MMVLADSVLERLLREDVPFGDLTTDLLGIGDAPARMAFAARTPQTVCCVEEAVRIVGLAGGSARAVCRSGDVCAPGQALLEAEGSAAALLASWKVAQTLVEACSGIATAVAEIVAAAARGGGAVVACTRKNFPGTRRAALRAVAAGGGTPHRLGLSDSILIFPEHRAFLDGTMADHVARLKAAAPERKVVAEVKSLAGAVDLAQAGVDALQLEKFAPPAVAEVVAALAGRSLAPVVAVAGGVNAANAEAYVRAGARVLVTSAPYWAKPSEVQVRIGRR